MSCERLPLEGLLNARDLGGFRLPGGVTESGVFIRSDVPASLTDRDLAFLKSRGLRTDLDLRSYRERVRVPDVLSRSVFVTYKKAPMYDAAAASGVCTGEAGGRFSWAGHYIRLIGENKSWMRKVLGILAVSEGCTLFHCQTGKDRTGLVAMALLGLCGVSDDDIIADYAVSRGYLTPLFEGRPGPRGGRSPDDPFFSSDPENMALLLRHINSEYGGVPGYLASCGVSEKLLGCLRGRLTRRDTAPSG